MTDITPAAPAAPSSGLALDSAATPSPAPAAAPAPQGLTLESLQMPPPVASAALAAQIADRMLSHDTLTDRIAEMLAGTYHCGRAWSAWGIGTMTEDDFTDLAETEVPGDIATMLLELIRPLALDAAKFVHMRNLPTERLGLAGQPCIAVPEAFRKGSYVTRQEAEAALARSMQAEFMSTTAILDPKL